MAGRVRGRFGGRATAVGAACLGVVAFGLSGCTPEEEPTPSETASSVTEEPSTETASPSPTPTPTEAPTLTPEEVNVEAAKQTVIEYYAKVDEVAQEGYGTWTEKLLSYWGSPSVSDVNSAIYQAAADEGRTSQGDSVVASIEALAYTPDPTNSNHEQLSVEYCTDYSAIEIRDSQGAVIERTTPTRFTWSAQLQRQTDGRWTFAELQPQIDRTC